MFFLSRQGWVTLVVTLSAAPLRAMPPAVYRDAAAQSVMTPSSSQLVVAESDAPDATSAPLVRTESTSRDIETVRANDGQRPDAVAETPKALTRHDSAEMPDVRAIGTARIPRSSASGLGGGPGAWWRNPLVALGAVLVVIVLLTMLARRFVPSACQANGGAVTVLGRTLLSQRQSVVVLQIGRKLVVAGVTPDRIDALCVLEDTQENADIVSAASRPRRGRAPVFDKLLNTEARRFKPAEDAADEASRAADAPLADAEDLDRTRIQLKDLLATLRARKTA